MGVDTHLYLPARIEPEVIGYAFAKSVGVSPPLIDGDQNIYQGKEYVKNTDINPLYFQLEAPNPTLSGHISLGMYEDGPGFNAWLLTGRATVENIAILKAIANQLGGFLEWRDSSGEGQVFSSPDGRGYQDYWNAAFQVEKANTNDSEVKRHAAY